MLFCWVLALAGGADWGVAESCAAEGFSLVSGSCFWLLGGFSFVGKGVRWPGVVWCGIWNRRRDVWMWMCGVAAAGGDGVGLVSQGVSARDACLG